MRRLYAGAFLIAAAAVAAAQDPPKPTPPAPVTPPPAAQGTPGQDPVRRDDLLFEKWRMEKDGLIYIYYRVGHERGRLLKALLEGASLPPHVQGDPKARMLTAKGFVVESEAMHLMIVADVKENIPLLESVLRVLDQPDPQVFIEMKVVELRWDKEMQLGLEGDLGTSSQIWINNPGSGGFLREFRSRYNPQEALTGGSFQGSTFRFNRSSSHQGTIGGIVQAFLQRGKAEILLNPRILVESGDQAMMRAGDEIPYTETIIHPGGTTTTVKYRAQPVGVSMTVKPHIVGAANVHLDLNLDVSALLGFVNLPTGTAPSFTTRSVQTKLTVRDKEEVVIGGLRRKEKTFLRRGVPFFSDIPILGPIFSRNEESETVQEILVFIRPVIIQSGREMPHAIIDPSREKK